MKNKAIPVLGILAMVGCQNPKKEQPQQSTAYEQIEVTYPKTKKMDNLKDNFFGVEVQNPYGWLEDDLSQETALWVKEQNDVTAQYLEKLPLRDEIKNRIEQLWNYEKTGIPFKEGQYTYFYKNDGLQNQSVLYRKDKNGQEEVFLDPNKLSEDGTTSLDAVSFTKDGSMVAFSISEKGSDWRKIIVWKTDTKQEVGKPIVDAKFTDISWLKNEGFFYSKYDKPKGSQLSAKTENHKLYYHKIGTEQSQDKVVFGAQENQKFRYVGGYVTTDQNYLVVSAADATSGNILFIKDLNSKTDKFVQVNKNFDIESFVLDNKGTDFYIQTNYKAPNQRLVKASLKNIEPENWVDVIPEGENVLSSSTAGGYIFANYMVDAISVVKQYNYDGKLVKEIELPLGSVAGFSAKESEKEVYYSFTNYYTPTQIYKYDIEAQKSELYWAPKVAFSTDQYTSEQVFYQSKDGTKVPMIITYKKGIKKDGTNPTMLYGYGGFNISLTPVFSVPNFAWIERGGIYAVANLRGGGEYGKKWHDAGTKMQKQNVFDDFIAAGEYLIAQKYTSSSKLAIRGGSNGGLLVGATMVQRPDLMAVAIPEVGVLDMLRYHKFTAGAGWAYDYGTADDSKQMFEYLKGYSPLENIKENVCYPATMVTTGDHDDRVVPAHSFKFAATLQERQACKKPTLIRIETNAGHGAGTPVGKIIQKTADIYAFALYNFNVEEKK